jgi:hypothetical protein
MSSRSVIAVALAALVLPCAVIWVVAGPMPHAQAALEPFAPGSPFRTAIAPGAAVDPDSAAIIAAVSNNGISANLVEFGIPIYYADAGTPRQAVECTETYWGPCPFDGYEVPIPEGARPHTGSDGAMVVVDQRSRQVFEFWQARRDGGRWTTSFGAVNNLDGSGWGGAATASGASRLGGVIQIAEIREGLIPHALAVQTNNACAGAFRWPATKTDGQSSQSDCLPEGARIQLDPTVDLGALSLSPGVRTVARALQTYGAYVIDRGGAPLSVSFELDPSAGDDSVGAVYQQAGFRWDYDNMPGVPWERLQVLA